MKNVLTYTTISEFDFNELLGNQSGSPFMVVFTADWLGEGTIMDTIIEKVAGQFDEEMDFFRVDVDASPNVTHQLGIRRLPAAYIFKDGEMVDHFSGMMSRRNVVERINRLL